MTERTIGYRPGLVDLASGQISREIFVNEEIYAEEQERIFARAWLFIGHESQIPNPGDYFVSRMGEESVLLCRDRAGEVHVFLNSCRHRGMKVCRYDEGNTTVFTCPYHGWSYGTDGRLVGVPFFREAYHSTLDRSQWGLVEVAQIARHKGSVWATWDPAAPPFREYLGDFSHYLDQTLDSWEGGDGGTEILGGVQKWLVPCNWKFPAENFSGDSYHTSATARSIWSGSAPPAAGGATCPNCSWRESCTSRFPTAAIRPPPICCRLPCRCRRAIGNPRSSRTTSAIARRCAAGSAASGDG
ncbi:MAG: aromatic ring-hydroxylating dioxygenase subunit alpha [Alphaproteobacteria bacterium]